MGNVRAYFKEGVLAAKSYSSDLILFLRPATSI
jgi:hypothetical protein